MNSAVRNSLALNSASSELIAENCMPCHFPQFWQQQLQNMIELECNEYNHFNSSSNHLNILTRFCVSCPAWQLLQLNMQTVSRDPAKYYEQGLSDHAPTSVIIQTPVSLDCQNKRIPSWVTKSANFKRIAACLVKKARLDLLPTQARYTFHKELLYEAAKLAREELFEDKAFSSETELSYYVFQACFP